LQEQRDSESAPETLRERVRHVIFESSAGAARVFDVVLIAAILVSVFAVMLDSVPSIHERWGRLLSWVEWAFTIAFTLEYLVRLWCIERPLMYARSFYGVIDLLGVLPTWISLFFAGTQYLLVIRVLRVLRVFRVLRMVRWVSEATYLTDALLASRRKILVFLFAVLTLVVIFGSALYVVEGPGEPFSSIPVSVYWAIVTLTTVGYGDIAPVTAIGRAFAACIMILGYGIIAVPTGIVTVELNEAVRRKRANTRTCPNCSAEGHFIEARYCWRCGHAFEED
jgi:voltage-gated potassium channel